MKRCKARLEDVTVEFCKYAIIKAAAHKKHRYSVWRVIDNVDKYSQVLYRIMHDPNMYIRDGNYKKINEGTLRKMN